MAVECVLANLSNVIACVRKTINVIACVWKTVNVIACPGGLGKEGVWRSYAAVLVKRAFCGLTF